MVKLQRARQLIRVMVTAATLLAFRLDYNRSGEFAGAALRPSAALRRLAHRVTSAGNFRQGEHYGNARDNARDNPRES